MKITESRTKEILNWLDDKAADHALMFAALIRQLQAAEQAAWHAGLDAGREQGRDKDHAQQPPSVPVGVAEAWQQGYHQGVLDERISEANIGIAGYNAKVEPARINPYLAQQPPSVPVGVEWPLSVLRAGHWREVHTGRRCMRLEVTYDYAAWERLMEQVEAALAQQPAAVDGSMVERALNAYFATQSMLVWKDEKLIKAMEAALIAAQPGEE